MSSKGWVGRDTRKVDDKKQWEGGILGIEVGDQGAIGRVGGLSRLRNSRAMEMECARADCRAAEML